MLLRIDLKSKIRFCVVLLICILAGAEVDIFIPSFPELQKIYNLSPFMVQLTVSINFIAYCVCSLFVGTMGDKYNRRNVILISIIIFVLGSVCCVCSINFYTLLIGRFLQGIGMAGPAVLGYVVLMDDYPTEKRPAVMGTLNGIVTLSMAFAPLLGSYINLYFGWQANFTVLLIISLICLGGGYFTIANQQGDRSISLSPAAYLEILATPQVINLVLGMTFLSVSYWLFVSVSPILYMESLGVQLKHFGFYQGSICGAFSIISMCSMPIINRFGQKNCLYSGMILCAISGLLFLCLGLLDIRQVMVINTTMLTFVLAVALPINIIYPHSLNILANSASRVTALLHSLRLLFTAIAIEVIGFCYNDSFLPIGIAMFFCIMLSGYFMKLGIRSMPLNS